MAGQCSIIPIIKVGNKSKESKLFKDLTKLPINNREVVTDLWALFKIPKFVKELTNIEYDENGEPTLESLSKNIDFNAFTSSKDKDTEKQKMESGELDSKGAIIKYDSMQEAVNKAVSFNSSNNNMLATVNIDNGKYYIITSNKTIDNIEESGNLLFSNTLYNKLVALVHSVGFDVTRSTEVKRGIFNPMNGIKSAEGLTVAIQVAEGKIGEESFPEEFAHFIVEGLHSTPLVQRLMELVSHKVAQEILGEEYTDYASIYLNEDGSVDELLIRKEAVGKLLHDTITKKAEIKNNETLLTRLWETAKSKFNKLKVSDVENAIRESNEVANTLIDGVITGAINLKSYSNKDIIARAKTMHRLDTDIDKTKKIAEEALFLATKRLAIIRSRNKNSKYNAKDKDVIKALQNNIERANYTKGISGFLSLVSAQITALNVDLNKLLTIDLRGDSDLSKIRSMSSTLLKINEFNSAYKSVIEDVMRLSSTTNATGYEREAIDTLSEQASRIYTVINNINGNYIALRRETVHNFVRLYWGEDKTITSGNNKGQQVTLDKLLDMADRDINTADRLISSMVSTGDPLLNIITKIVRYSHHQRDNTINKIQIEIRKAHNKLQNAGFNPSFMYELDDKGIPTGRTISTLDFASYYKNMEEYKAKLIDNGIKGEDLYNQIEIWKQNNTDTIILDIDTGREEKLPKKELYSKKLTKIPLAPAQMAYYKEMIEVKRELDKLLPSQHVGTYKAIQIRTDGVEIVTSGELGLLDKAKMLSENAKDSLIRRSDDTDFGDTSVDEEGEKDEKGNKKYVVLDFTGKPIQKLPIYFTRPLEDMRRLSTDFSSSMIAYANMAINYNEMSKVVDALELTRSFIQDRAVKQSSGDKQIVEKFVAMATKQEKEYTKEGRDTNIGKRLDDYFDSVVYEKRKVDHGSFKLFGIEIDIAKAADLIKSYTGIVSLGLNAFSGLNNITIGNMQMFYETIAGEFFNSKDMVVAEANYYSAMPQYVAEFTGTVVTNKLKLMLDKFDALDSFHGSMKATNFYTNTLSRLAGGTSVYILQNMGEHYLHTRTMLAMLNNYKVLVNGKETSLYNALEVIKEKDSSGKVLGGFLEFKKGTTKLNGEEITEDDIFKLKSKIRGVNQSLNGAFGDNDKGAIHKYALGRLAMQFRQWMPEYYYRRLSQSTYNANFDEWREGYYITLGRFSYSLIADMFKIKTNVNISYSNMSAHEKSNIKRSLTELTVFGILAGILSGMGTIADEEDNWVKKMARYQLERAYLEVGASVPLTPAFITNIPTILHSPAAAMNTFESLANLFFIWNIGTEIERGRYEGRSVYSRDAERALPIYGNIRKALDLTEENYMFNIFNKN